ncbi:uncharacterized protein [Drosophila takahashii]|uniref:uncharacterized protein isoform X1 n=2 Tax=Drosophila takahashii TaxID=29030 RepID=UPI003898F866
MTYVKMNKLKWTNIKCSSMDESFCVMEYCYIKPINRTYKYISIKAKLLKTPVTKIKLNFAMYKRVNGYLPFLYNITVDSCRFLKNTTSQPIAKFFYELFKSHSNMNHTCPYDHDIIIDKLSTSYLNYKLTEVLPVPEGQYLVQTNWYAYDILRVSVGFYIKIVLTCV